MTTMMMMKPSHNTTSTIGGSSIHKWSSPVPYLFGGLAIMMGLIAVALLILACTYKKPSTTEESSSTNSNNVNDTDHHQEMKQVEFMKPAEMEPKFVVIMPGDFNPTCLALAKPTFPSRLIGPDQV